MFRSGHKWQAHRPDNSAYLPFRLMLRKSSRHRSLFGLQEHVESGHRQHFRTGVALCMIGVAIAS
jgi:hypothetical protein